MEAIFDGLFKDIQSEVLSPCPFCGHVSSLMVTNSFYNNKEKFWVFCPPSQGGCGCSQDARLYDSPEKAVEAWNSRASSELIEEKFIEGIINRAKSRMVEKLSK